MKIIDTQSLGVSSLKISPNQDKVALGFMEGPLKVYDMRSEKILMIYEDRLFHSVTTLDWFESVNEEFVIVGYDSGYIRIIDMNGEDRLKYQRNSSDYGYPFAAQLHPVDVQKLKVISNQSFSISTDGVYAKLELDIDNKGYFKYSRAKEYRKKIGRFMTDVEVFNKEYLLIIQYDSILKLPQNKFHIREIQYFQDETEFTTICSLNVNYFITGSKNKELKIWNSEQSKSIKTIALNGIPYNLNIKNDFIFYMTTNSIHVREKSTFELLHELDFKDKIIQNFDVSEDLELLIVGFKSGEICFKEICIN
ncbi:hypothetical protein [Aureivirga sp. CE67]|uniref:WD40 domain-containing protein n=1 Tax=Aureivirga sp. CE67 TaxID=1788983 RepID=UPI0018CB1144|nr:hypothetical protein [Aureivirga sp. CE67]